MQNPPPRASFGFSNQHRNAALLIGQHECDGCIFADLTLNDNYRQACSLTSGRNILFVNCQFLNTGMTGGTAPQAGVDFEPNGPADYLVNVTLRNCSAKNNVGGGFFLSYSNLNNNSEPVSIVFDECSVDGQHGDFNYGLYAYALPGYPDNKTTAVNGSIHWRGGSIGGTLNSAIAMSVPLSSGLTVLIENVAVNGSAVRSSGEYATSPILVGVSNLRPCPPTASTAARHLRRPACCLIAFSPRL